MSGQFGWVIKWALVGIPNRADRKDSPYRTASIYVFQLYLVNYIIYVGRLTYIGHRLNIAHNRIEFIAKLVASLFGFFFFFASFLLERLAAY